MLVEKLSMPGYLARDRARRKQRLASETAGRERYAFFDAVLKTSTACSPNIAETMQQARATETPEEREAPRSLQLRFIRQEDPSGN